MSVCQICGVCCVVFCVDFYLVELVGGVFVWGQGVLKEMIVLVIVSIVCMVGIDIVVLCCVVLVGEIGWFVVCIIYDSCLLFCWEFDIEYVVCNWVW